MALPDMLDDQTNASALPLPAPLRAAAEAFPAGINKAHGVLGGLSFTAQPVDASLFGAPTLAVEARDGANIVATYRYNFSFYPAAKGAGCLVLSPLLVKWADSGAHRKPGHDRLIIDHCVGSLAALRGHENAADCSLLLTTGYLTVQRAGSPFFSGMGWRHVTITSEVARKAARGLLRHAARRIDALSLPDRSMPEELSMVRFAFRLFPARAGASEAVIPFNNLKRNIS